MRAFIHTVGGKPLNDECATAQRGFEKLGIECIPFSNNETLDKSNLEDVVVGGMLVTEHALAMRGVKPPRIDYPESLKEYLGREVWRCPIDSISEADLPLFIKPENEKELSGIVAQRMSELENYLSRGNDYPVLCSEPVEFVSEERLFLRYGELIGVRHYSGDHDVWPDVDTTNDVIRAYTDAPAGCAIDLGVTKDDRTVLVEVNDGFALGCYGMDSIAYALLLAARWAELVGVEDELAGLDHFGFERGLKQPPTDKRALVLLDDVEDSTSEFSGCVFASADWIGACENLVDYLESGNRTRTEVWRWIAAKQGLDIERGPDGRNYIFPRMRSWRRAIDVDSTESVGCSKFDRYNKTSAGMFVWATDPQPPEPLRSWLHARLADYCEADVADDGMESVFVLIDDLETPPGSDFFANRGYQEVPEKDEEDLARAFGVRVLHDGIMEKPLNGSVLVANSTMVPRKETAVDALGRDATLGEAMAKGAYR